MSVKSTKNNNLESVVFNKINSLFDLEAMFESPSSVQLLHLDGTNNQMTLTIVDENGEQERAVLHFCTVHKNGIIEGGKSFRLEFDREGGQVKADEVEKFGSLEELNNLF